MDYIETSDYLFKVVLANKILLALSMKECLNEYKDCDINIIINEYIEAHILKDVTVHENIVGNNTEKITDGKKTTFDVLFFAKLPDSNQKIGIIINAEAQSIHNINYDVLNRAHYYNARNISSQYKTLWEENNYDELRKVVSIWFILDPPKYKQGSMNRYAMNETHIIGNVCEKQKNIDKNEIVMVYLSQGKCENEFIQIMSDISNRNVSYDDMKKKLSRKYGVFLNEQFEMEVMQMCNYGSYVFNEGKLEGKIEGKIEGKLEGMIEQAYNSILKTMKNFKVDFEQAITSLELDEELANACRKRFQEENK